MFKGAAHRNTPSDGGECELLMALGGGGVGCHAGRGMGEMGGRLVFP